MRLTWSPGCQSHLSHLIQFALILVTIQENLANCYTSEVRVPTLGNTKHVEVTIHPDEQIVSLTESIKQLNDEISIAQSLPFDTFKDLMMQKFELSTTLVMSNSLQILTSDQGVFSFKSHSTNSSARDGFRT